MLVTTSSNKFGHDCELSRDMGKWITSREIFVREDHGGREGRRYIHGAYDEHVGDVNHSTSIIIETPWCV